MNYSGVGFKRSKTPTVLSSACFRESYDPEVKAAKEQFVRPAVSIKNPFVKYNDSDTSVVKTPLKESSTFSNIMRCETEVGNFKTSKSFNSLKTND